MRGKVLEIDAGAEFIWQFRLEDADGPVDLEGYEGSFQVALSYGTAAADAIMNLTVGDGLTLNADDETGRVRVYQSAEQTRALSFERAKFELDIWPAGAPESARRLASGRVDLYLEAVT
jgi:hypothetical protein